MWYVWRLTEHDPWLVYSAETDLVTDEIAETMTPSDYFDCFVEAQTEADRRNRERKQDA